jgi:hypothetical protein
MQLSLAAMIAFADPLRAPFLKAVSQMYNYAMEVFEEVEVVVPEPNCVRPDIHLLCGMVFTSIVTATMAFYGFQSASCKTKYILVQELKDDIPDLDETDDDSESSDNESSGLEDGEILEEETKQ